MKIKNPTVKQIDSLSRQMHEHSLSSGDLCWVVWHDSGWRAMARRRMKEIPDEHAIIFLGIGREEKGLGRRIAFYVDDEIYWYERYSHEIEIVGVLSSFSEAE